MTLLLLGLLLLLVNAFVHVELLYVVAVVLIVVGLVRLVFGAP